MKALAMYGFFGALLLAAGSAMAINKCTGPDGKVSFQDAPCAGRGEKLDVRPASGSAGAAAPAQLRGSTPVAPPVVVAAPPIAPPAPNSPATKSPLQVESEQCLAWHRPLLRDPAGAYMTAPSKEGRVVRITVHATNGYGGYVTRSAECEFLNGKLDEDWTKIHAKRNGWSP